MRNPWLDVTVADYEGHMLSAEVGQLPVLSHLLGEALGRFRPRELLLLGCATGNGLSRIDPAVTRRVVAVDIQPAYVTELRRRYADADFELQAICADVMAGPFPARSFDLVYCALLLEYLDWRRLAPVLSETLRADGVLGVVLQRPSADLPVVTPTRFTALQQLDAIFQFVEPAALAERMRECGLTPLSQRTLPLDSGKAFEVLYFSRAGN